jgi:subfamily B ATP-binding cassette protein MsbA
VALLYAGALAQNEGDLSQGGLAFAFGMSGTMLGPLENLVVSWIFYEDANVVFERRAEVLGLPPESSGNKMVTTSLRGDLEVRSLGFEYPGRGIVLEGVSFVVPFGSSLAIVGESGAGKSTLLAILAGLLQPMKGDLLLGGISISEVGPASWRKSIGAVFHRPILFDGTLAENILLGLQATSTAALTSAASAARVDGLLKDLPEGFSTRVTGGGTGFSAGQVQRLAIARALARDPDILLLDEATSNLDEESESAIWNVLKSTSPSRTLVFITHRLKTSALADRILVLKGGRVVEWGSFDELMLKQGTYCELWQRQGTPSEVHGGA